MPMNFAGIFRAFEAAVALREVARRFTAPASPESPAAQPPPALAQNLAGQLEASLTNVVVAALKEAFDRDHARLELERAQLDEQRRRAEEAMRAELRRQAADREIGRLRLLAATALIGWIASVALFVARLGTASTNARVVIAVAWLVLLGALGAAFTAQGRVSADSASGSAPVGADRSSTLALWLLIAGLALSAISLLF